MTQTKKILSLLNENGSMTQGKLAEAIYGDKLHGPNIYSALMTLVNSRRVIRTGAHPALYSLADGSANEGRRTLSDDSCFVSANIKSVSMSPEEAVRLIREYYNETKLRMFQNHTKKNIAIINYSNKDAYRITKDIKSTKKYFSSKEIIDGCYLKDDDIYYYDEKIINVHDLKLQGAHNYENVMCAIMVSKELNIDNDTIVKSLKEIF